MLTFKEFLCEWSTTSKGVNAHMEKLGYERLGKGVDQTAWMKPGEDSIIKIFGTSWNPSKRKKHSDGHLMFKWWADYCKKNKSNPFLPKFDGWEAFEFDGNKYLQIRMEQLSSIPTDVGTALEDGLAYWGVQRNKIYRKDGIDKVKNFTDRDPRGFEVGRDRNRIDGIAQLMMLLGEKKFDLLFKTIEELAEVGRENNWDIDLHKGNFMYRNDGTPVIVDPFVV